MGTRSAVPERGKKLLRRLGGGLRDLLYPRRCLLCHRFLEPGEPLLCPQCAGTLPEPISGARRGSHYRRWASALWYEDEVRDSILRFKFGGCAFYAEAYGPLLARAIRQELGEDWELLSYVPLSRLRRRKRGYDQTLLLAKAVGRELGREPVCTLRKRSRTRPQSRMLSQEERQRNILGAFSVPKPELVRDKRILLIDDILTTGATVSEAARILREAGAKEVQVAALAVTPK